MNLTVGATLMKENRIHELAEELADKLKERDSEIEELKSEINTLKDKLDYLGNMIRDLYIYDLVTNRHRKK